MKPFKKLGKLLKKLSDSNFPRQSAAKLVRLLIGSVLDLHLSQEELDAQYGAMMAYIDEAVSRGLDDPRKPATE